MFEAVGSLYAAGKMTEEDVNDFECHACPTCGSCSGMYTANSMNCLTEALWYGISWKWYNPGSIFRETEACKACGYAVMEMYKEEYLPKRYYYEGCYHERIDSGYGTWMLY